MTAIEALDANVKEVGPAGQSVWVSIPQQECLRVTNVKDIDDLDRFVLVL